MTNKEEDTETSDSIRLTIKLDRVAAERLRGAVLQAQRTDPQVTLGAAFARGVDLVTAELVRRHGEPPKSKTAVALRKGRRIQVG